MLLVRVDGDFYGVVVERLLGKREAVQKTLGELLGEVPCAAGATLIDDRVAIVLDVPQLVQRGISRATGRPLERRTAALPASEPAQRRRVLIAEDSEVVRETLRRLFEDPGDAKWWPRATAPRRCSWPTRTRSASTSSPPT